MTGAWELPEELRMVRETARRFMHNDVKQAMARGRIPKDKASMRSGLHAYMRGLQRRRAKVRSFFKPPSVRYAA